MDKKENLIGDKKTNSYTMRDAITVADDIYKLTKDKKYKLGAFIHGLIFALEYAQFNYKIPQQQIATIKRDCRKYFTDTERFQKPDV
jgi:hypothetical protein